MFGYLITDPKFYPQDCFENKLYSNILKHKPQYACLRDKQNKIEDIKINEFLQVCKKTDTKSILNGSIELAKKFKFTGVHLTGAMHNLIKQAKDSNLLCIASCHNAYDVKLCIENGADFITLSPIFETPQKGKPLGEENFLEMCMNYKSKVIALGGIITSEHLSKIAKLNIAGFASIRYFCA